MDCVMQLILMPDRIPPVGAPTEPVIAVRDLRVRFDDDEGSVRAVEGVSFEVRPGQTVGIVGESGCGKSVTARSILRIPEPNSHVSGQILFRSKDGVRDLMQLKPNSRQMRAIRGREIALVFQEPMTSFSPVHTIGSQIIETIRLHSRVSRVEARARAIEGLRQVRTPHPEHILDQYAWQLSGGLRQRAMIAMALACDPAVLIADEPTTALDVTTQAQVLELLRGLLDERHMALMLITHDLGVIAQTADFVLVMYLGTIVEQGPVEEVFHAPRHPYTRALLRSMPNVLAKPRTRIATLRGSVPHPLNRPAGCAFHPRCPSAIPGICQTLPAQAQVVGAGHAVSCHLEIEHDGRSIEHRSSADPRAIEATDRL
jgi:oligopeptide/dipeptide ABC transporter ATP-binding protein